MSPLLHRWSLLLFLVPGCGSDPASDDPAPGDPQPSLDPPGVAASDDGLSDEFDDPATLSRWRRWHEVLGVDPRHELLDIGQTNPDQLTVRPRTSGWFGGFEGPLLYKMIRGDFMVETSVAATKIGDPSVPPDEQFNSAGLLVRDPVHGEGRANWVMYNVGRQLGERVASEGKTTVNSESTLELADGANRGRLRICRLGSSFILARQLEGESQFIVTQRYERGDLPAEVQVGMIVNGWNSSGQQPDLSRTPDLEATFDYVRFSVPTGEGDCTAG